MWTEYSMRGNFANFLFDEKLQILPYGLWYAVFRSLSWILLPECVFTLASDINTEIIM